MLSKKAIQNISAKNSTLEAETKRWIDVADREINKAAFEGKYEAMVQMPERVIEGVKARFEELRYMVYVFQGHDVYFNWRG